MIARPRLRSQEQLKEEWWIIVAIIMVTVISIRTSVDCKISEEEYKSRQELEDAAEPREDGAPDSTSSSAADVGKEEVQTEEIPESPIPETIFDDDEDDDDDEEFYLRHPLEQTSFIGSGPQVNDSDFDTKNFGSEYKMLSNTSKSLPYLPLASSERGRVRAQPEQQVGASQDEAQVQRAKSSCAMGLTSGNCLTYGQIESAVRRARRLLAFQRPSGLNSVEPSEATINAIGELNEMTSRVLAAELGLGWEDIMFGLEQIDVSGTSLWRLCPRLFRLPPTCSQLSRYRTHTGLCNNLLAPQLGASNMPFRRELAPEYADGLGAGRRASSGGPLPPARLLALLLHPDVPEASADHSALFMSWGQLVNHDLAMASGAREGTGHEFSCCQWAAAGGRPDPSQVEARVCMPIEIGRDDPLYAGHGIGCHEFKRSLAGLRPGCSLGPRSQLNVMSSYVDASFVYGASRSVMRSLRANSDGLLSEWHLFGDGWKPLLPAQLEEPDAECVGRRRGRYCFRSGDPRTNQQVPLVALHTIYARQHNRLARALGQLNPHWPDGRLYHEARHIQVALLQHALLSEYLPALLGERLCAKYELEESPPGVHWAGYRADLNAGISPAFAAAAFRLGHSQVPSHVFRFSLEHEPRRVYLLRQLYRQPWPLYEPGALDEFLLGLVNAPARQNDPFVSAELSGHLLQVPGERVGLDLTAINIQRGRDQGLANYNAFRQWCGLKRAKSFQDLDSVMSNRSSQLMGQLYESVDDIDLFSAGLSEFPLEGAQLGPTFACIVGRQFQRLRQADRFWFELPDGPQAFTGSQLASIKQVSLARLICANSDRLASIQRWALRLPHPVLNPRLPCDQLPDLDISLWLELEGRQQQQQ